MNIYLYNSTKSDNSYIIKRIEEIYPITVVQKGFLEIPLYLYNAKRKQYYAPALLALLKEEISIWIVNCDIYLNGMSFVFGLAEKGKKAIVSIYRLNSKEMVEKEVIHEVGHAIGLSHCEDKCVMQFSNSLSEAQRKPSLHCERCQKKIRDKINI